MKKVIYLTIFIILGVLLSFLIHSLFEVWYLELLIENFDKYSLGFSWNTWFIFFRLFSIVLFIIGSLIGFWQGKFWWQKIYESY